MAIGSFLRSADGYTLDNIFLQDKEQNCQRYGADDSDSHPGAIIDSILCGVKIGHTDGDQLLGVTANNHKRPEVIIPVTENLQDAEGRNQRH